MEYPYRWAKYRKQSKRFIKNMLPIGKTNPGLSRDGQRYSVIKLSMKIDKTSSQLFYAIWMKLYSPLLEGKDWLHHKFNLIYCHLDKASLAILPHNTYNRPTAMSSDHVATTPQTLMSGTWIKWRVAWGNESLEI